MRKPRWKPADAFDVLELADLLSIPTARITNMQIRDRADVRFTLLLINETANLDNGSILKAVESRDTDTDVIDASIRIAFNFRDGANQLSITYIVHDYAS